MNEHYGQPGFAVHALLSDEQTLRATTFWCPCPLIWWTNTTGDQVLISLPSDMMNWHYGRPSRHIPILWWTNTTATKFWCPCPLMWWTDTTGDQVAIFQSSDELTLRRPSFDVPALWSDELKLRARGQAYEQNRRLGSCEQSVSIRVLFCFFSFKVWCMRALVGQHGEKWRTIAKTVFVSLVVVTEDCGGTRQSVTIFIVHSYNYHFCVHACVVHSYGFCVHACVVHSYNYHFCVHAYVGIVCTSLNGEKQQRRSAIQKQCTSFVCNTHRSTKEKLHSL